MQIEERSKYMRKFRYKDALQKENFLLGASILLALVLALPSLIEYLKPGLNLILVILSAPFVLQIKGKSKASHRYFFLAVAFFLGFLFAKMRIFYLLAWGASILYFLESQKGSLGFLPFILLFLLSPVPAYLAEVFTFPIRLWMSEQIAAILSVLGFDIMYQGNLFVLDGKSFSIDPVCMGLNSLVTGLIIFILLIAFAEQKYQKQLSFFHIADILLIGFFSLVLSNFMRMICLVLFQSSPETASHEMIGMISLILYAILPMYFFIEIYVPSFGKLAKESEKETSGTKWAYVGTMLLLLTIALCGFSRDRILSKSFEGSYTQIELAGMQKSLLEEGINKYEREDLLVYIKAPSRFWGSDHSPSICWRASGYKFDRVEVEELDGRNIYVGILEQGENKLHTAWWYDNGSSQTHSQIEWRWKRLKGEEPFLLLNVTSTKKDKVLAYAKKMLDRSFLN